MTSEGGTASNSVTIKRDATPPVIAVAQPASTIYTFGAFVPAAFTCTDALSGTGGCASSAGNGAPGEPIDTSYTGFDQQFYAWGHDQAGNFAWTQATYDVSLSICWPGLTAPRAWWRMEGDTNDLSDVAVAVVTVASATAY